MEEDNDLIIIGRQYLIFNDRLIFFPNESELQKIASKLSCIDFARVRLTTACLSKDYPGLIHREIVRSWCIDLTKDIENVYREMNPKTTRYRIRKAEKMRDNLHVCMNDTSAHKDFFNLYNNFVRTKRHTYMLSEKRFKEYLKFSDVFVIYFKERPICGHLRLRDDSAKRASGVFAVSTRLNTPEDAKLSGILNRYLIWHELQTYKDKGVELYDFGGCPKTGSIAQYKMSFGGFPVEEHCYVLAGSSSLKALGKMGYNSYLWIAKMRARHQNSNSRHK